MKLPYLEIPWEAPMLADPWISAPRSGIKSLCCFPHGGHLFWLCAGKQQVSAACSHPQCFLGIKKKLVKTRKNWFQKIKVSFLYGFLWTYLFIPKSMGESSVSLLKILYGSMAIWPIDKPLYFMLFCNWYCRVRTSISLFLGPNSFL